MEYHLSTSLTLVVLLIGAVEAVTGELYSHLYFNGWGFG